MAFVCVTAQAKANVTTGVCDHSASSGGGRGRGQPVAKPGSAVRLGTAEPDMTHRLSRAGDVGVWSCCPPAAVVNLTFIGVLRDFSVASERYGTSSSI